MHIFVLIESFSMLFRDFFCHFNNRVLGLRSAFCCGRVWVREVDFLNFILKWRLIKQPNGSSCTLVMILDENSKIFLKLKLFIFQTFESGILISRIISSLILCKNLLKLPYDHLLTRNKLYQDCAAACFCASDLSLKNRLLISCRKKNIEIKLKCDSHARWRFFIFLFLICPFLFTLVSTI
jgi:hypothetical protein